MYTRGKFVLAVLGGLLAAPVWAAPLPQNASTPQTQPATQPAAQPETQPADLPAAESLFEAYIQAIGGREKIAAHHDRTLHGIYRVYSNGDTQILTLYTQAPDKMRAVLDAPALGSTIRCTNGQVAWGTNVSGTPFQLPEHESKEIMDSAFFAGEAAYKDRYESIKTVGTASFEGKPAYQVDFVTKTGLTGSVFFDVDSKLVVARQIKAADGKGDGTLVLVTGYKEFEGVLFPTKQQQRMGSVQNLSVEIEFRWIDVNTGNLPSFDPPGTLGEAPASE